MVRTILEYGLVNIILSSIYMSPKNLGGKFELIWATKNLILRKMDDFQWDRTKLLDVRRA